MSKSNFQKMIELSHTGSGVNWESIALKCFVLLTDEQIDQVARAEGYLEDEEENSDKDPIHLKIRQLAEQADKLTIETFGTALTLPEKEWQRIRDSIFAKTIVIECINEIKKYEIPIGNSPAGEIAFEWTLIALEEIKDSIRKKFGLNHEKKG